MYALTPACEAHEVDPIAHLPAVLFRIETRPAARFNEPLPRPLVAA